MENQLQITVTVPFNADNNQIAAALRMRAGLFEGQTAKEAASRKNTDAAVVVAKPAATKKAAAPAPVAEDEDDDFKADTGSESNGFDDDEDAVAEASFDDAAPEEEEEKPAPKKAAAKTASNGKAKKITLDDVNDACKAHAAAKGRQATLAILQKKFKTQSVTALKPEQYEMAIAAMAVN